ncbi:DUF3177 family protein [Synechocystis sp. LKSZ1]|uniref:DUF3177 family protein n=1 Tax=Synechocystis sp. LKSZ1 TaxID=3144951 RepID=UPI00336BB8EC
MENLWFQPLVWLDYRLAFIFTVIIPLVLLVWSLVKQSEAIHRLLLIYWRVASLLMISLYLFIPGWTAGYVTSFLARLLIPISLWFWVDLNDEIKDLPASGLKLLTTSWRWAITIYCSFGVIAFIPFLSCTFSTETMASEFCQVWLPPAWRYKELFHANATPGFLGFLGIVGLIIYSLYFLYFLIIRLARQGRSALEQ